MQSTRRKPTDCEYARLCRRLPHASQSGVSLLLQKHHGAMKLTITPGFAFTIASNSASSIALGSPEKIVEGTYEPSSASAFANTTSASTFAATAAPRQLAAQKRPMNPLAPASSHMAAAAHAAHAASDARDAQEVSQCDSMYAAF